jgi:hypothetical protein
MQDRNLTLFLATFKDASKVPILWLLSLPTCFTTSGTLPPPLVGAQSRPRSARFEFTAELAIMIAPGTKTIQLRPVRATVAIWF